MKLRKAGISGLRGLRQGEGVDELPSLPERIDKVLGVLNTQNNNPRQMIYFIMYDIESNKVRTLVAKYLIRKGCTRVQKSIFIASTERPVFDEIRKDLKEVQECYDNSDSIILVPVSTDEIRAMKVIGQNIDFDLALKNKNTLFI
ncbi:MAG TPA: CRISPR-associated endonuclease Cas2 [Syntrophomonas sp.]|nr:CRISPR-associated endonuclease Cas2 [Syntrophomonas sp.]